MTAWLGLDGQKTLGVPQRWYSLSRRASRPGAAGVVGRTSACSVTWLLVSTDHRLLGRTAVPKTSNTSSNLAI
jgi:hypothetical protein